MVSIQNSDYCIKINAIDEVWICCFGSSYDFYTYIIYITICSRRLSKEMKKERELNIY